MFQRHISPVMATLAVTALAACGGGGSGSSPTLPTTPGSIGTTPAPTAAPTVAPASVPLGSAELAGAVGFINAPSRTVYVFDADLAAPGTSTCSGSCSSVWPPVAARAGATYAAPFTSIKRSDGSLQIAYAGRPLYTYIGDSAAGSIAGNGLVEFGGAWHIARPAGTATAAPSATPTSTASPVGYP